jgi:hypothetical protein
MFVRPSLLCVALILTAGAAATAQTSVIPPAASVPQEALPTQAGPGPDTAPGPIDGEIMHGPEWDQRPTRTPHWNFDFAYVPTTFFNRNDHMAQAYRLDLGRQEPDGYGQRGRLWYFQDSIVSSHNYGSTFNYDFFKVLPIERGELLLGAGPMVGILESTARHRHNGFYGVGAQADAEGFYPLFRFEHTDIGPSGYGRVGLLAGVSDDNGGIGFSQNSFPIVDEFAWGLELRHRFGRNQDKCYYIDVMRQLQDWGRVDLPYVAGTSFQGTAINFGLGW